MSKLKQVGEKFFIGDKPIIRVTDLLTKHGLATDYSEVPEVILEQAAKIGDAAHQEFQEYFEGKRGFIQLSPSTQSGIKELTRHKIDVVSTEHRLHNDVTTGQIDIIGLQGDKYVLVDIKTTTQLDYNAVSWQLSTYAHLVRTQLFLNVEKVYVLWYNPEYKKYVLREVRLFDEDVIEALLGFERDGKDYHMEANMLILKEEFELKTHELFYELEQAQREVNRIETQINAAKDILQEKMTEFGMSWIEIGSLRYTNVLPSQSRTYDWRRMVLDNNLPLEPKYERITDRKGYLRITERTKK